MKTSTLSIIFISILILSFLIPFNSYSQETNIKEKNKAIDFSIGFVPNTDGFLDGMARVYFNYLDIYRSGLYYKTHGMARKTEEKNGQLKYTRTINEKIYGISLIGLQPKAFKLGFMYLYGDLGFNLRKENETIDGHDFSSGTRIFYSEDRKSNLIEPRIDLYIDIPFSEKFIAKLAFYYIPLAYRKTDAVLDYSDKLDQFNQKSDTTAIDVFGSISFLYNFSKSFGMLLGFDYRRQVGIYESTKYDASGNLASKGNTFVDQTMTPTIGFGLYFLKSLIDIQPIVTFGYAINRRLIIDDATNVDDVTLKNDQFQFGLLLNF